MLHGLANCIFSHQGGPRGDERTYSTNYMMFMAQRPVWEGTMGFRSMMSLEPTLGRDGYPLLLQTGETADGVAHLIDRQHPHDLFMELAGTYSIDLPDDSSAFFYFGVPGEPALGPPAFMHRFSGEDNPEAPIAHHWLDSTHITYGVITFGYTRGIFKFDNSFFRGREPDQFRWNVETPRFDSYSFRFTLNPSRDISMQVSYGHLTSPEQLNPDVDVDRLTVSATYNKSFKGGDWQTTFAYGCNYSSPGHVLSAFLLESELLCYNAHTFFGRAEMAQKDELFNDGDPLAGDVFTVSKASFGYIYDFFISRYLRCGAGASGSLCLLPGELDEYYGDAPWSYMFFLRVKTE